MANSKVTGLTQVTDPFGNDVLYLIDGASADGRVLVGDFNLLPDGVLWNGKISVTVSSNNITVAIKTRQGNNPSATEPVTVHIGGTRRRITAALSVTKNAGTNWFSSGSTVTAAQEIDYFVYLLWNTTPATDIVDLGFARVPYGRLYSDFSTTTTNDRYLAFANASTPTSTDECVVIGRFAASLSATPNFSWSVPTFTNNNLIQRPIWRTRRLTFVPSPTGYSAVPTDTSYQYMIDEDQCTAWVSEGTNGTSSSTSLTMSAPITAATITNGVWSGYGTGWDNSAQLTTSVRMNIPSAATSFGFFPNPAGSSSWTNSGGKRISVNQVTYSI